MTAPEIQVITPLLSVIVGIIVCCLDLFCGSLAIAPRHATDFRAVSEHAIEPVLTDAPAMKLGIGFGDYVLFDSRARVIVSVTSSIRSRQIASCLSPSASRQIIDMRQRGTWTSS